MQRTVTQHLDPTGKGLQAYMVEAARQRPGSRVLEIGSGGYNAALIAEVVESAGSVVSLDIDADVVTTARRALARAGYRQAGRSTLAANTATPAAARTTR